MSEQRAGRHCRVTRVDTHLVGTRWCNWVFAQVHTDDGITGVGEGTCEWQARAVEAAIAQLAERYVVGSSAFEIERLWRDMFRNEFARGGPILNSAIGAIEMALWDILGKALDQPVHQLLGGRVRDDMPAYANAWYGAGADVAEIAAAAAEVKRNGYPGLKFDPFGSAGRDPEYPAIRRAVQLVEAVREADRPRDRDHDRLPRPLQPGVGDRDRARAGALPAVLARGAVRCRERRSTRQDRPQHRDAPCDRRALLHQASPPGAAERLRGRRAAAGHHPCRRHPGGQEDRRDRRCQLHAGLVPQSVRAGRDGGGAAARRLHHQRVHAGNPSASTASPGASIWSSTRRGPSSGRYQLSDLPGLGVGAFQVEAAKAHPFDPKAFLPMWSEDWRKRF